MKGAQELIAHGVYLGLSNMIAKFGGGAFAGAAAANDGCAVLEAA